MCGIVGLGAPATWSPEECGEAVQAMAGAVRHRGPDDEGFVAFGEGRLHLGFRRLSILDLSAAGHQPMASPSGRYTIVFNGEVYNYRELREELISRGFSFRGSSDTEVALAAFEAWGIREAVERFIGMFAMGVWDAERSALTLVRDRLGIKPLHYYQGEGAFAFASELKALMACPAFRAEVDPGSLAAYLRYLFVPAPRTIFRKTWKVRPGHLVRVSRAEGGWKAESEAYWSIDEAARAGLADPITSPDEEVLEELESLLRDAVRLRLRSDVPLGAFLSGGIDSSLIVSFMEELEPGSVRTFSIGFDRPEHDETDHAAAVAHHLGTDHRALVVSADEVLELVPKLATIYDEPLADTSQIPTYLVSRLAREGVTVALSGDGGDELFGGYHRYVEGGPVIRRLGAIPHGLRAPVGKGLRRVSSGAWDRLASSLGGVLPSRLQHRLPGLKIHKVTRMMTAEDPARMYRSLMSAWDGPDEVMAVEYDRDAEALTLPELPTFLDRVMAWDQAIYLPDDLLAKLDRASMAVSLEARVPILDHRVVELSWRMPARTKIRDGAGKWALRELLHRRVPREIVDRPKVGFTAPVGDWMRGGLRGWAEERLAPDSVAATGMLDPEVVWKGWKRLLAGDDGIAGGLWTILMFVEWERAGMGAA